MKGLRPFLFVLSVLGTGGGLAGLMFAMTLDLSPRDAGSGPRESAVGTAVPAGRSGPERSALVARNLFRRERNPPSRRYDPSGAVERGQPTNARLEVVGVMLGARRSVLVRGLPGIPGIGVLWEGERIGEIVAIRIGPDTVTFQTGSDTVRVPFKESS